MNFSLLQKMCAIHAPSGNESAMTSFILDYVEANKKNWKTLPQIIHGEEFQDCIMLVFGSPRTAVYAHIDNIGFTARYNNELVKVGGPRLVSGYRLTGADSIGKIECQIEVDEEDKTIKAIYEREIEPGTDLSFASDFREDENYVQSCYLDNRLGVFAALNLAETLENGVIVFSCWEEHGGGTAGYLAGYLYHNFKIRQALISDITWITERVVHGKGAVVSMRDSGIPRRTYVNRIRKILDDAKIPYQIEVESSGGSDGNDIQKSPFPIDWCFIGAAEDFVHTPDEKVHKADIQSMIQIYQSLMKSL
jgi:putative aminopeptidase FrvX